MCSVCKSFQAPFLSIHTSENCPFRASLYCSFCAAYGHSLDTCEQTPSKEVTQPAFEEQLIPSTVRAEMSMTTQTPIGPSTEATVRTQTEASILRHEQGCQGLLRIKKDDKVVRAFLAARSLLGVRIKSKNAKEVLNLYAKEENKQIECFPDTW